MPTKVYWGGKDMGWGHVQILMLGSIVEEVTSIKYDIKQEKTNNYGSGIMPKSRSYGKVEFEASITLNQKEVQKIYDKLPPGNSLIDIAPFDITIAFVSDGYRPVTHRILNAEFLDEGIEAKQGDSKIEKDYKLIVANVLMN